MLDGLPRAAIAGTRDHIDFADGSGVEAGKTVLEYKGVAAGTVESWS
jgi:paraquat-inducible protein B